MNGLSNSFLVLCGFSLKPLWDEIDGLFLQAHEHFLWVHVSPIPLCMDLHPCHSCVGWDESPLDSALLIKQIWSHLKLSLWFFATFRLCIRGGKKTWILGKISYQKERWRSGTAAQKGGRATIPGGVQESWRWGTEGHGLMSMVGMTGSLYGLSGFSYLHDYLILSYD